MAKGAAGAAEELEELQPSGDPVEEYQEKLIQLAQLLDEGSTEERVRGEGICLPPVPAGAARRCFGRRRARVAPAATPAESPRAA